MIRFKQFLTETPPHIDKSLTKGVYSVGSRSYRDTIHRSVHEPKKSSHIGDNHFHFINSDNDHVYYHHDGDKVKELSTVSRSHVQVDVEKGEDGDANHIHSFMLHHTKKYGRLSSDTVHTNGSKHLWKTLIKKSPEHITFHHMHDGQDKDSLTRDNIDDNEKNIWGEGKHNHQIEMRCVR